MIFLELKKCIIKLKCKNKEPCKTESIWGEKRGQTHPSKY